MTCVVNGGRGGGNRDLGSTGFVHWVRKDDWRWER